VKPLPWVFVVLQYFEKILPLVDSRLSCRLRVVSNFGDADCGAGKIHTRAREISRNFRRSLRVASPRAFARARVYFARPTITIAKIRDYLQSTCHGLYKMIYIVWIVALLGVFDVIQDVNHLAFFCFQCEHFVLFFA